jgi:prefoldin subunit 5
MINDVRADIPDIPEVKYYDKELEELAEQISNLPEVRYYDGEVEAICDQIDLVREQIKGLPEVKYYDEQVDIIEDRIDTLQTEVANLPEVKYYDSEIAAICESIDAVKASIPKFPKWINEVNEVPDFSWIGKTFSVIEDDFIKVRDKIEGLRGKVDFDLDQLSEDVETKYFNNTVKIENDISNLSEKVDTRIDEEKDRIWKELRSSSLKMWEYHKEFKDDDRKLKKQILGEYNTLKQNINKELKEINYTSTKTDELLLKYFTELREEISGLPEVKYYDKDIDYVKSDIKGLYKIIEDIKSSQKQLKEEQKLLAETNVPLGSDPPDTDNPDPLNPLNQDFVTLDQLQKHYKIFVERVQYQLASIGGGGAGFIKDLDDVDITGLANNYILQYDSSVSKWKTVVNNAGAAGTWASTSAGIHTTKNVGIGTTARSNFALYVEGNQYVDGNITVGGTITYDDVRNVDSVGIITARQGIVVVGGGITAIGVITATSFVGDGTNLTGVASTDNIITGTAATFNNKVFVGTAITMEPGSGGGINITGVGTVTKLHVGVSTDATEDLVVTGDARITGILTVGTGSVTINGSTNDISGVGVITATSFQGDGSALSGISTGTVRTVNIITATDGQTLFPATGTISYDVGYVDVYINGVKQATGVDYTGTSGTSITLTSGVVADDTVEIVAFTSLDNINTDIVLDTTPQLGGNLDLNSKTINGTGDVNITGVITATTFNGSLATSNLSGTVTNDQLAGSIANAKLANSSIAIGGITFSLGDTDATPAFDLSDATDYPFTSLTGITTVISGDSTPTLGGNLGLNSKTINGTGNVNITGVITATSFVGNITGDVTGNADTATTLATARTIGGVSFDGSSSINLPGVNQSGTQNTSGTAAGLSGSPDIAVTNITSGIVTATSFVGSKLGISGLSTSKDLLVTGITSATNTIEIKSNDSTPGRIDLYCETNNAHYARLQAPPHAEFSGNITATLPASSGTLLHSDSSGNVIITGIVTASSFVGSLTGSASSLSGVSSSFLLDYNNFTNTPTIPTNNNQLTNGAGFITTSFTNTNQLTNGAGFITTSFTNTNQLTNGAGFITSSDDISGTAAGLTGTPNITVGSITAASAEFSGNVTIGGTLSYEDVTNVDAVGILTAREGIQIPNDTAKLRAGADLELQLFHDGTNSVVKDTRNAGKVRIQADNFDIIDKDASETMLSATVDGAVELNYNGSKKLETTNTGVVVTGICTASAFVDDGTNLLTEINTKASTGKAIAMAMVFG